MNVLHLTLNLFSHSNVFDWPKLAFCLFAMQLRRLIGLTLVREVALCFDGIAVHVDIDGSLGLNFINEVLFADIYRPLPSGRVVFDVGANCGLFALKRCSIYLDETVFCFEPHPRTFERLRKNIELNGYSDRVGLAQVAVGAQSGVCSLNVSSESSVGIVHGSSIQYLDAPQVVSVLQMSLDDFAVQEQVLPDILKIDVEGFEVEVLKGATLCLRTAKAVMLEFHSADLKQQCVTILTQAGYQVYDNGLDILKRVGYQVNAGGGLLIAEKQ